LQIGRGKRVARHRVARRFIEPVYGPQCRPPDRITRRVVDGEPQERIEDQGGGLQVQLARTAAR
jgi:hypothetical protein